MAKSTSRCINLRFALFLLIKCVVTEAFTINQSGMLLFHTETGPSIASFQFQQIISSSTHRSNRSNKSQLHVINDSSKTRQSKQLVSIEVVASAGITNEELPIILSAADEAITEQFGINFGSLSIQNEINPAVPASIPGAMGRVLLLSLNNVADDWEKDDERLEPFKNLVSQQIDSLVGNQIEQPVLVSVRPNFNKDENGPLADVLSAVVENEAMMYGLCTPMVLNAVVNAEVISPSIHIEIDGAMVPDPFTKDDVWDTSSILVFDDFVDDPLRERLLDVVNKRDDKDNQWNDKIDGPDPRRWTRGGLMDIPVEDEMDDAHTACWGLTEEAINELCFEHHAAITEVEQKIADLFAADFFVSRLPEAVLGSYVSPLTANAPTYGDSFSYHIDADPNQMPPSPWTDVFGRYFNRVRGKPRFVSCLLYLNDEWDDKEWGAPTQFYDPPTEETYQVFPRPGRCVLMDQDVTHRVVAPNECAGNLPRYSLVWKLILHPRKEKQSMSLPTNISPVCVGSANSGGKV